MRRNKKEYLWRHTQKIETQIVEYTRNYKTVTKKEIDKKLFFSGRHRRRHRKTKIENRLCNRTMRKTQQQNTRNSETETETERERQRFLLAQTILYRFYANGFLR